MHYFNLHLAEYMQDLKTCLVEHKINDKLLNKIAFPREICKTILKSLAIFALLSVKQSALRMPLGSTGRESR